MRIIIYGLYNASECVILSAKKDWSTHLHFTETVTNQHHNMQLVHNCLYFLDWCKHFQNLLQWLSWSCTSAAPWWRSLCSLLGCFYGEQYLDQTFLHKNNIYEAFVLFQQTLLVCNIWYGLLVVVCHRLSYTVG